MSRFVVDYAQWKHIAGRIREDVASNRLILPSLPDVAVQVRQAAANPSCSAAKLASIIAQDPAISARVLKVVNSAAFRPQQPIRALRSAVARLGTRLVRDLVTSLAIVQLYRTRSDRHSAMLAEITRRSTAVAAAARALAACRTSLDPELATMAGLVHDIGLLPLLRMDLRISGEEEENLLETLHPLVGALVLDAWGLPEELSQVAREHETLERDPGPAPDYVDLVIVANLDYRAQSEAVSFVTVPAARKLDIDRPLHEVPDVKHALLEARWLLY